MNQNPRALDVVYFDVGGTILTVNSSVGDIYADGASRLGHRVDPQQVNVNFRQAWRASLRRRAANGHRCDDEALRADWCQVVVDSFRGLLPVAVAREAFEELYDRFCCADAWKLAETAVETFEELRALGYRLGILSNWDARLEKTLEDVGVLQYFEHRVVSYRVGVEKPHPGIFREALRQAATTPDRILHVGDSLEWDVWPAQQQGFHALWVPGGPLNVASSTPPPDVDQVGLFSEILGYIKSL